MKSGENTNSTSPSTSPPKVAVKRRWNLLQNALLGKRRRLSSRRSLLESPKFFDIFSHHSLPERSSLDFAWFRYDVTFENCVKNAQIRHSLRHFTPQELAGFNNTGNVRIWPSEEFLTYISLKNESFFRNKTVLEVGGGMSCLVGVFLARYVNCRSIHVTDGHPVAVENVRAILDVNETGCPISCDILLWDEYRSHSNTYDVIVLADCLFFDESHTDLIQLLRHLLKPDGTILAMAPGRKGTLRKFMDSSSELGFRCSLRERYDQVIWRQHNEALRREGYEKDLHYPLLLVMDKRENSKEPLQWPELDDC